MPIPDLTKAPPQSPPVKPGYQTTEVWLAVAVVALGAVLVFLDKPDAGQAIIGLGLASGGYSMARARAKTGGS